MNLSELNEKLRRSALPPESYSLTGGLPAEAFCIEHTSDGVWQTYYSEWGLRSGLKTFATEEEACNEFLKMVAPYL
ncbi:conserved hypothetical protein [Pirellula staleyi DSM 6068]|uniref:Uncharacterized protein n=1 Tax=Pirellula staleyi (strain ATCC 27377 / DSM 6068 / ICPB 4128) TaxID=530564 RepID=D2R8C7_PIRSD|nr:conserved hypothetical protein [Pirellula staleyi DSM 6068]